MKHECQCNLCGRFFESDCWAVRCSECFDKQPAEKITLEEAIRRVKAMQQTVVTEERLKAARAWVRQEVRYLALGLKESTQESEGRTWLVFKMTVKVVGWDLTDVPGLKAPQTSFMVHPELLAKPNWRNYLRQQLTMALISLWELLTHEQSKANLAVIERALEAENAVRQ